MEKIVRRKTRTVRVRDLEIGGSAPVSVQSMTNTDTRDVERTLEQIQRLDAAGCQIVRLAVPDMEAARAVGMIRERTDLPLVADIHFDYRLALECAAAGVDKIRINPGNVGGEERVREVAHACAARGIPIRIGVNSGSLEKKFLEKYGSVCPEAMVDSALSHAQLLERWDFGDIVLSLKSSDPVMTIRAYRQLAERCDYPFHLGVTECGSPRIGILKSAIGIGSLLAEGIGDTIRVSLTADPVQEVPAGFDILKALGLQRNAIDLVACPTCGRTRVNLISLVEEFERRSAHIQKPLKVAIMGCAVNGPGEARDADIGVAGGDGVGLLFKKGEIVRRVPEDQILDCLLSEIEKM